MNNIVSFGLKASEFAKGVASGGGGGDNGDMEARVAKLESIAAKTSDGLIALDKDIGTIKSQMESFAEHYATKADLFEMKADLIKWIVGTAIGLGVAGITVMTFVLNNAIPKAQPMQNQPPIIINVPGTSAPPPVAAASPKP